VHVENERGAPFAVHVLKGISIWDPEFHQVVKVLILDCERNAGELDFQKGLQMAFDLILEGLND
jgi:hypothetical protein